MAKSKKSAEVSMNRRAKKSERRDENDRRTKDETVAAEQRQSPRRKKPRRRQIDPTTCERDYTNEEIEFMHALDDYKRDNGRMFPTCSEILEVIRALGYDRDSSRATPETPQPVAAEPVAIGADEEL